MAKETRTFRTGKDLGVLVPEVSNWIEKELGFPPPQHSYDGAAITITMKLKGLIRSVLGQNRIFSITFRPASGSISATYDDGGWKKYSGIFWQLPIPVLSWITALVSLGVGGSINVALKELVFIKIEEASTGSPSSKQKTEADYIRILELEGNFTASDIKQNYKKLLTRYHPDKVQHLGKEIQDFANKKTLEINEAYGYFRQKLNFDK